MQREVAVVHRELAIAQPLIANAPTLYHAFSGNGMHLMARLLDSQRHAGVHALPFMHRRTQHVRPRTRDAAGAEVAHGDAPVPWPDAFVFDSVLGSVNAQLVEGGFVSMTLASLGLLRDKPQYEHRLLSSIVGPAARYLVERRRAAYIETLRRFVHDEVCGSAPALFLHSMRDVLIPYENVRPLMDRWMVSDHLCHIDVWQDSAHVQMFKDQPERYATAVRSFVEHGVGVRLGAP